MKGDFFRTSFLMATFKIRFDQIIQRWWQQCCIFRWQSIPAASSNFTMSLCGVLRMPADVRTILSYSLSNIDPAVLLGQCFLFCISGLFLSSPLSSTLTSPTFQYAFLFPYRRRVFCESPFFRKWSGSYFQKPSRVPFPQDYIKTWVILLFLSASAHTPTHAEYPFCILSPR